MTEPEFVLEPDNLFRDLFLPLLVVALFFVTCVIVPYGVKWMLGPWVGIAAAAFAPFIWLRFVRPMPGLLQGSICIAGFFSLIAFVIRHVLDAMAEK